LIKLAGWISTVRRDTVMILQN